jgi:hypothetical protein
MEIAARKQKRQAEKPSVIADIALVESNIKAHTHSVTVQFNALLYTTLQNMIASAHTASDFTYTSVTDVIRAALQAYKEGMELTELPVSGAKKNTSIRLNEELYTFYQTWPSQLRTKILERVVRSFLKKL